MEISLIDPAWHDRFLEESKDFNLSDDSIKLFQEKSNSQDLNISGNTSIIPVLGPLTNKENFFFMLFGGGNTTYPSIINAIKAGESDDKVKDHKLLIDSPGGNWIGLTETVQTLAAAKKPIVAEVTGMATSAAYVLAAQADFILSTTGSNDIGGLGVVTSQSNNGESKTVRSTNAPNKNPDAFTKPGEKELIKQLDAVENKAFKMVSEGRSAATGKDISEKVIKKDFGQGASMFADDALSRNMIDEITEAPARISNSTPVANPGKGRKLESQGSDTNLNNGKIMELAELKREHPELCAQLVEEGRTLERDQVKGHVTMAKNTGAVEFALECLAEGKSLQSQEVIAGYMSAGMKKTDLQNRENDNTEGDLGTEGNTELSEEAKEKDLVSQAMKLSNKPANKEV